MVRVKSNSIYFWFEVVSIGFDWITTIIIIVPLSLLVNYYWKEGGDCVSYCMPVIDWLLMTIHPDSLLLSICPLFSLPIPGQPPLLNQPPEQQRAFCPCGTLPIPEMMGYGCGGRCEGWSAAWSASLETRPQTQLVTQLHCR